MSNPEAGRATSARRVLAVIPARGGSKGVPAKNLAPVGGVPLVARAVRECLAARLVTDVVVSTDDHAIAAAGREAGAEVVLRPAAIAGDTATSEAAVLHAMDAHEALHGAAVDVVMLVQCTSPFILREDIDGVARAIVEHGADTALTVAPFHGFIWRETADEFADGEASRAGAALAGGTAGYGGSAPAHGAPVAAADGVRGEAVGSRAAAGLSAAPTRQFGGSGGATRADVAAADHASVTNGTAGLGEAPARLGEATAASGAASAVALAGDGHATPGSTAGGHGVNHDKSFRPRRQDRPQDLLETGAAYAMDAAGLRKHQHRFFGRTELVRTDPARVLEIDDPHDLARAQALAPLFDANRPGALPTYDDIDAVVLDFDGTQTDDRVLIDSDGREFVSVHRGDGLGIAALRKSGLTMLILSSEKNPVVAARARKLQIPVLHGIDRKDLALKQWCEEQGIAPERVLYVGNDVNDLPCFALVGWPVAVGSAHDVVRGAARAVTTVPGGEGAIREIAGWILGPSLDSLDPLDK
ncbi:MULTISPECIES: N-acylneuraminate cytidylyltransferase [Streptomyces]|uniref:N-acylneuraminate cytidylyltransferase n=1 Tax=Streptomyces TaxID=1883 RepID=UPI000A368B03|nr:MULTISPECIES: N-acylneuraminate cytidylyltransferase [Streptomyces]MDX3616409.1 N-acylneuraminate cytidylyltransferase [Streptomyces europaeiscabiei]MDX3635523.1 N-acylneuraminate cytidylyltransferase [Streptomyces europaeiscabiei]MDX3653754.1 N-acylneuraminate cytidylyltransferase [Streptomyces europaeiscabiei]WUD35074.1 N-acylneuraminate cytidylyltransferase [Streptomyces europaeiscabiei]